MNKIIVWKSGSGKWIEVNSILMNDNIDDKNLITFTKNDFDNKTMEWDHYSLFNIEAIDILNLIKDKQDKVIVIDEFDVIRKKYGDFIDFDNIIKFVSVNNTLIITSYSKDIEHIGDILDSFEITELEDNKRKFR